MQEEKLKNRDKGQSIYYIPYPLSLILKGLYFYYWFVVTYSNYFLITKRNN